MAQGFFQFDPLTNSLSTSPYIQQVAADAARKLPLYGPAIPMGAGSLPTYGPGIPMGAAKAGSAGAQNRLIRAITDPALARRLTSQNRAIQAITNPNLAQRLIGQNRIVSSIANPTSLPYGATQGINMSGGIPYGAVTSARFGSGLNAAGGVGSGMYGPAIPMGPGSLPTYGPAIPMGPGSAAGFNAAGGVGSAAYGPAVPTVSSGLNAAGGVGTAAYGPAVPTAAANTGLLARLGFGGPGAAGTSGFNQFIRAGLTPRAALTRLGGGALAGQLGASMIVDPLNIGGANSALDRFGTGAAFGAGLGAAVGNVIPIPGVGAGIGAGVGALIGGGANVIMGMFDDNSKADQSKKNQKRMTGLNSLMETAGLTDSQRQQYMAQYNTQLEILRGQGQDNASNVAKLLDATEQQISKVAGSNTGKLTSKDMVALQAAIGEYMQPLIQQQQMSGDIAAQLYNDMAGNMGGSAMANLVRGQAAGYKAQADALSAAYMGAAQNIPALYGLQQTGQLANQQQSAQSNELLAQLQAGQ